MGFNSGFKGLINRIIMFCTSLRPPVDQSLLNIEAVRSHPDTPQSVGLLWTQRPLTGNTSLTTYIHAPGGIRTRNPSKRPAADTCLRPHGHWHWQAFYGPYNKPNHILFPDMCKIHFNIILYGVCPPEVSHQNAVCLSPVATTHTVRRLPR